MTRDWFDDTLKGALFISYFDLYSNYLYESKWNQINNLFCVYVHSKSTKKMHAIIFFDTERKKLENYVIFLKTRPVTKNIIKSAIHEATFRRGIAGMYQGVAAKINQVNDLYETFKLIEVENII